MLVVYKKQILFYTIFYSLVNVGESLWLIWNRSIYSLVTAKVKLHNKIYIHL